MLDWDYKRLNCRRTLCSCLRKSMANWYVCLKRLVDVFVNLLNNKAVRLVVRAGDSVSAAQTWKVTIGSIDHTIMFISFPVCGGGGESNLSLALSMIQNSCDWRSKRMDVCQHKSWCSQFEICENSTGWSQTVTCSAGTVALHFDRSLLVSRSQFTIITKEQTGEVKMYWLICLMVRQ